MNKKTYKVYGKEKGKMIKLSSGEGFKKKKEAQQFARSQRKYYKTIMIF